MKADLVTAYLVTTSSSKPIFGVLLKKYLPDACKEVKLPDERNSKLWITVPEAKVGKNVRLGLVPYGMSFDKFSDLLDSAFWTSVDRYVADSNGKYKREDFSLNIVRVYPSRAFFRQFISPTREKQNIKKSIQSVTSLLGELMGIEFDPFQNLTIILSLENVTNEGLAIVSLLTSTINDFTSLYEMGGSDLEKMLPVGHLRDYFESRGFDKDLSDHLGKSRIQAAVSIYRSCGLDDKLKEEDLMKFQKTVAAILLKAGIKPATERRDQIAKLVFDSLYEVGFVLEESHALEMNSSAGSISMTVKAAQS